MSYTEGANDTKLIQFSEHVHTPAYDNTFYAVYEGPVNLFVPPRLKKIIGFAFWSGDTSSEPVPATFTAWHTKNSTLAAI